MLKVAIFYRAASRSLFTRTGTLSPSNVHKGAYIETERIFTAQDVLSFSTLTGDVNPVHFQPSELFKQPIVHGILVASLFSFLVSFDGAVYVKQTLDFKAPVIVGSPVYARVEVVESHVRSKGTFVKCTTVCLINERKVVAVEGTATVILPLV